MDGGNRRSRTKDEDALYCHQRRKPACAGCQRVNDNTGVDLAHDIMLGKRVISAANPRCDYDTRSNFTTKRKASEQNSPGLDNLLYVKLVKNG